MALDLLMMITKNNTPIEGESLSAVDTNDELTKDFKKYVEIDDFDFGVSLSDHDSVGGLSGESLGKNESSYRKEKYEGKFSKFIQGQNPQMNGQFKIYPVLFDEASISRQIDKSSPILFQTCFQTKSLDRITVVKRKSAGQAVSFGHIPYLRVDFDDVLITDMSWSISDHVVKEKLKFVYRKITMKYRPQDNDGKPLAVVSIGPLSLLKTSDKG